MKTGQGHIDDIFREALANHEMEFSPKVWAGIQSSLGAQTAAATGSSLLAKAAAVVGISTIVGIGAVNEARLLNQHSEVAPVATRVIETATPVAPAVAFNEEFIGTSSETQPLSETSKIEAAKPAPAQQKPVITVEHPQPKNNEVAEVQPPAPVEKPATQERASEPKPDVAKTAAQPQPKVAEEPKPAPAKEETPICAAVFPHQASEYISANGDGIKDCFEVAEAENVASFKVTIWTRSGQKVFESTDLNFRWCGTDMHGNTLNNRTMCYYHIEAVDHNGVLFTGRNAKGSIMVITAP